MEKTAAKAWCAGDQLMCSSSSTHYMSKIPMMIETPRWHGLAGMTRVLGQE